VRRRPSRDDPPGDARAADRQPRPPLAGGLPLPDRGPQALPLRPQPADPRRLPRRDPPAAASSASPAATAAPSASSCSTRPTRAARRRGCSTSRSSSAERGAAAYFFRSVSREGWTRFGSPGIFG
jgi:hypothetical protein